MAAKRFTETCPKCKRKFTKDTAGKAKNAVRLHFGRMHTDGYKRRPKKEAEPASDEAVDVLCDIVVRLLVYLRSERK